MTKQEIAAFGKKALTATKSFVVETAKETTEIAKATASAAKQNPKGAAALLAACIGIGYGLRKSGQKKNSKATKK